MTHKNLLRDLPAPSADEAIDILLERGGARIERIVSHGQVTPPGQWLQQAEDEWVALIAGAARLTWEDGDDLDLEAGDWVFIASGRRHRVAWTQPGMASVWLAVHLSGDDCGDGRSES